jgi:lipoprotein NlpD
MMYRQSCFFLTTILFALLLTACASNGKKWNPDDYTVKSGDTVYSIAWRYELDPEEFAAWNNLGDSKYIKAGQRLHTREPANFDASRSRAEVSAGSIAYVPEPTAEETSSYSAKDKVWVQKGDTLYGISQRYDVSVEQLARLNQLKKPYALQPGQTIFLKPFSTPVKTPTVTSRHSGGSRPATVQSGSAQKQQQPAPQTTSWPTTIHWQRPANGKIVKKYNRQLNDAKGIDIAGKYREAIVASADGKVVYSGNGLISYGNLIIIKHNKTFLSAYAYNDKLLVKEGDVVRSGQKIAEMGRKDDLSPRLHFEIRKNGKPDDPLKYLPW